MKTQHKVTVIAKLRNDVDTEYGNISEKIHVQLTVTHVTVSACFDLQLLMSTVISQLI